MKNLAFCFLVSFGICAGTVVGVHHASADSGAPAQLDAGPQGAGLAPALVATAQTGTGSAGLAITPADQLHNPITDPGKTISDIEAAKKVGWAAAFFAVLLILCRLVGGAKSLPFVGDKLTFLGKGKAAVVVAGGAALAGAGYNVAAAGGSWMAILIALGVVFAHYIDATPKPASA